MQVTRPHPSFSRICANRMQLNLKELANIMSFAIVQGIVVASAIWVYFDAARNRIGKIPGRRGMFNMSAGGWGFATLGLWIVALPAYLIQRKKLIAVARVTPIESKRMGWKAGALAIVGGTWCLAVVAGQIASGLPGCDDSNAKVVIGKIVNDLPVAKASGIEYVSVKDVSELGFNPQAQVRSCAGTLVTTAGEDGLQYAIKWSNTERREFYVQLNLR